MKESMKRLSYEKQSLRTKIKEFKSANKAADEYQILTEELVNNL